MTPHQKKLRNSLERSYLSDLLLRTLKAPCPRCMATVHGERKDEANRRGYVRGPRYWASHRNTPKRTTT